MSDAGAVVLAVAVWLGALVALPIPRWAAVIVVGLAFVLRRPSVLVIGGALLAGALGATAWAGLDRPPSPEMVRAAAAVLLSDPIEAGHATRVDVRIGDRRVEAWARGAPADALRDRAAGEVVELTGRLRAPPASAADRLAVRHIAARIDVTEVGASRGGSAATRAANEVRRVLERGMSSLPADREALLRGFLIGDDRDVPSPIESDFRAAGLTHLLAVSGSNLAYVMAAFAPLLHRLQLRGRLVASVSVIAFFAVVTRAEPSVLRASAMAAIACWAAFSGRPVSRVRVLALAVAALVLLDPMLVRSVGFQLSVGACLGLALLAAPLATRLPGPRWLAEPAAVTLAAQAGVAPVLLTTFGGLPVVTILANLLAVPVAGPLTAWGLVAGVLAGVVGGPVATLLHVPSGAMVGWIASVARVTASLPLGSIDLRVIVVVALVVVVLHRFRRVAVAAGVATMLVVAHPSSAAMAEVELARGAHLWRAGATVLVLDGDTDSGRVLEALRRAGIRRIDLVVARRGTRTVAGVLLDLRARVWISAVVAPVGHQVRDATAVARAVSLGVGRLSVHLEPQGAALDVDIGETAERGGGSR